MKRFIQCDFVFVRRFYSSMPQANTSTHLTTTQINESIKQAPDLQRYDQTQFQNCHQLLKQQGLPTDYFLKFITKHPILLSWPPTKFADNLEIWRGTQFGDQKLFELLERNPELLEFSDERYLRQRLAHLKQYAQTTKNVWRLFMNSPTILTDPINNINAKIDYFQNQMKVEVADVVKSTAFSHTLDSIKTRHVFLQRLGLYKWKNPKAGPLEPSKNPRMNRIMDTSDLEFANKVAQITIDEFEVFEVLYKRELSKNDGSDFDDPDDNET